MLRNVLDESSKWFVDFSENLKLIQNITEKKEIPRISEETKQVRIQFIKGNKYYDIKYPHILSKEPRISSRSLERNFLFNIESKHS